jgi:hypothetical protein
MEVLFTQLVIPYFSQGNDQSLAFSVTLEKHFSLIDVPEKT